MHGVWDAMDLAGNAEERRGCWRDGVLKASCQPASAPCNLAGKACSVTGCRPIKSKIPTISCVSKLPPKWREFYFLHVPSSKPCNLASAPLRLGHGLSPYKKAKKQIFLRERAPDEICFYLFCMACSFREKKCLHYGKRYGRLIFAVT